MKMILIIQVRPRAGNWLHSIYAFAKYDSVNASLLLKKGMTDRMRGKFMHYLARLANRLSHADRHVGLGGY